MRWYLNHDGVNTGDVFDDGIIGAAPGDPEFTRGPIDAEVARRGSGWSADWMGPTDPPPDATSD